MKQIFGFLDKPLIAAADALRDQRRWAEAAEAYREILRRRPGRAGVWVQLGHCLARLNRPQEALDAYYSADRLRPDHADTLFHIASMLRQFGDAASAQQLFARVLELKPERQDLINGAMVGSRHGGERPQWLDQVAIGTTGLCNASCVHCPTGKLSTAHAPRTPMPMPLYRKIIDEIAESGLVVAGNISFGLFGDGLVDPFVVERARYLREKLPDVVLNLNTNGAAYDPARHAVLNDLVSVLSLHCESLDPKVYDYLMQPLRADRVHARYPMILRDFPNKVTVAVPVSRLNVSERPAIDDYFYGLGAVSVFFMPMSNRLANDEELFDRLSFAPVPIRCDPQIMYNLIIDCDGTVLACCNDFGREEPVGNLSEESLSETLANHRRLAFQDKLAGGCHSGISTCNRCRGDLPTSIPPI